MNARLPPEVGGLQSRLQLLIEAVIDYGIFILDPRGYVVSWNAGAQKLKGYTRDEIVGQHFSVFYPPEAQASGWPQEELRRTLAAGRFEDEGWRVRKDGSRFWANVVITALHDSTGEHVGFAKVTRDLTERRMHEEELRASEERMRLLVENVRDYAIFMLDPDGTVRGWNVGAQAIKGYTASEIIGRHFSTFYTPEDQQLGKPAWALQTARTKGRVEDEGWRVRKDGTLFWANVVITAILTPSGELLGFGKVTRDMTDRRRLEDLERSSRRLNEFLAMLAHELRNPLAPMRNAVTVMQLEELPNSALRNCRDIIDRQLRHVTRLVDELLDVGRLNTGKVRLQKEATHMRELVNSSIETVKPLLEARRHALTVTIPADPIRVEYDKTRVSQILQNLLVNAAKYTPDGGQIEIRVEQGDGWVNTSVIDNGSGIERSKLGSIFELFAQGNTLGAQQQSGLGIGLTLARSLAEMHGGTIEARSAGPGLGSTFILRLPASGSSLASHNHSDKAVARPRGARVLVIDDNRDSADTAGSILRLLGHEVQVAYEGAAGLQLARSLLPEVVLLDLAMPHTDGYETLRLLRVQPGMDKTFVIAMTGFGGEDDKRRTAEAGFDAHLIKPFDFTSLIDLLHQARAAGVFSASVDNVGAAT